MLPAHEYEYVQRISHYTDTMGTLRMNLYEDINFYMREREGGGKADFTIWLPRQYSKQKQDVLLWMWCIVSAADALSSWTFAIKSAFYI